MILTWKTVTAAAGGLALIVVALNNVEALAERFPLTTKAYVAQRISDLVGEFNDLKWDQAYDRASRLDFEITSQQLQVIQLQDNVEADPDIFKRQVLQKLRDDITDKQKDLDKLKCQIEQHDAEAVC